MNPLYQAAQEVSTFMTSQRWAFCIIGGLAVVRWGEPRSTQDVDLALLTGFGAEERFADVLLSGFQPRSATARSFALQHRVLLVRAANGVPLDIAFAAFPFEERMIQRVTTFAFAPDCELPTCSAEDLIVLKAFAGRVRDWEDIEMIRSRQRNQLDWSLILEEFKPLAAVKEAPEALTRLTAMAKT